MTKMMVSVRGRSRIKINFEFVDISSSKLLAFSFIEAGVILLHFVVFFFHLDYYVLLMDLLKR